MEQLIPEHQGFLNMRRLGWISVNKAVSDTLSATVAFQISSFDLI
jgi:hypothetical protein